MSSGLVYKYNDGWYGCFCRHLSIVHYYVTRMTILWFQVHISLPSIVGEQISANSNDGGARTKHKVAI
jgi:hypothetical protein